MSKDYDVHNYLQSRVKYLVRNGNSFEVLATGTFISQKQGNAIGLFICTLISENQGLLQTLEKFQVPQTWIFFYVST